MTRLTALTLVLATASLFAQKTSFATQQTALDAAYGKKDWTTYLDLATRLGEASPHNGLFWYQRGIGLAWLG